MSSARTVTRNVVVDATPQLAFQVLTETGNLRDWFCDTAWSDPRPGGRYALHWAQGYHVEGRFLEIDPPRRAVVSWHGTGEPGETRVAFELQEQDGGVNVQVVHSGFGPGSEWDEAVAQARRGWDAGLENLKSTVETGIDLRTARQPFLGIHLDLLTPERAARENIAAQWGIYVEGVVDGSGAQAAGLGHSDVIVSLGGMPTNSFEELGAALRARQAGDSVEVERVRGQARDTLQVTLGSRPQPELPDSAPALADRLAERQREANDALRAVLENVSDQEASLSPGEGDWSVREVLAHLSENERAFQMILSNLAVTGYLDGGPFYPDEIPGRLESILIVAPTVQGLLDRFLVDEAESEAFVRRLPETAVAYKARFRRIANQVLALPDHVVQHVEQIRQALARVRDR
ncbi:MAG: PDZ domain-containing protein [Anaerolineaceae bacterium]|nr:PDZ domain-containing protein [Anaerolineaceae bacterium]